ncbi:hypothetical protein ACHAXS_011976 [Conticribra weissflogii]
MPKEKGSISPKETVDVEEAVVPADDEEQSEESNPKPALAHQPSFFTDNRGNLKVVNIVVRRPCTIFTFIIVLCVVLSFLLQVIVFRAAENGNPFTVPENEFDVSDERSIQYDSLRLAQEEVEEARKLKESAGQVTPKQSELADIMYWVFEAQPSNEAGVFGSRESIEAMKDGFDIFLEDTGFRDFCLFDYQQQLGQNATADDRECRAPLSPLTMYYASSWDSEKVAAVIENLKVPGNIEKFNTLALCYVQQLYCDRLEGNIDPTDAAFAMALGANITSITSTWDMKGELVENITQVTELASYLIQVDVFKGFVDFGFDTEFSAENPISKFSRGIIFWGGPMEDSQQGSEEEMEKLEDSEDDIRKDYIKENYLEKMDKQSKKSAHSTIRSYYFMTAIIGDVILNIVTKDATLAIFSFVFVFLWIRLNTRSWFLAFVGLFEIFFSIPVAWFIFTVIFQIKYFATLNSLAIFVVAAIGADDIFIFMDAYKQSQYHVDILCDLETRMSWVYRRTGVAMAITSATTCAAFLCTLITPLTSIQSFGIFAAVVIFIDYVLVMTLFCTAVVIYHNRYENNARFGCCCPCGPVTPSNTEKARLAAEESDGEMKRDRVSEFFRTKVSSFIQVPLHRIVLFVLFATWIGCAIWQATMLEATKENEQFLDENHPLQKSFTILGSEFPTADDDLGLKVYYAWGLSEVDRSGVNRLLDPEYYGTPQYEPWFDFSSECQTAILDLCDDLKTNNKYKDLIKRKNGLGQVYNFVEELAAFSVKGNLDDCDYVRTGGWRNSTWQVEPSNLATVIPEFLKEKSCYSEDGTETISGRYQTEIGWDGTTLKYAAISVESAVLDPFGLDPESLTRREYDQFIAIGKEVDETVSRHCFGSVIVTDLNEKFVFMNNQAIYVQSALQSSILGICIAFAVLLISTRVLHLALFASISITCVLISVVGTMVMLGWQLGSIESILIGIIAGFSVDYVVHLAHAYEIASGDCYDRLNEAFSDLGISVFNGMITSVVASIPLFFCQLQFFAKFGTFLCLTIAFSWVFANFGFMSVLAQLKIPVNPKNKCFSL